MLANMTAAEFGAWQAYFGLEPWGCKQEDLRAGVVAATIANVFRDRKVRDEPFTASDFIKRAPVEGPDEGPEPKKTPKQILHALEAMALSRGGKDLRKQKPRYE